MRRKIKNDILNFLNQDAKKKALLVTGARQIGKTYIIRECIKETTASFVEINFIENKEAKKLFSDFKNTRDFLLRLSAFTEGELIKGETIIFLDEVQECKEIVTAIKFLVEEGNYKYVLSGSLLGVELKDIRSIPVGYLQVIEMYPMDFEEFCMANNVSQRILDSLKDCFINKKVVDEVVHEKMLELFRLYLIVGGMPEVVKNYIENKDFQEVREIQNRILSDYKQDFSHHIPPTIRPQVTKLWDSIPRQLAKENKKFVYSEIENTKARVKEYDPALEWLKDSGLVYQIMRLSKPALPIKAYQEYNSFKLFMSDIGLLSAKSDLDIRTLLEGSKVFTEFKGSITEQFVLQELKAIQNIDIAYWANDAGRAEIDFVIQLDSQIIPVEVKAGINLKAKSLNVYKEKFNPDILVRTSLADYKKSDNLCDIPLYMIEQIKQICNL